MRRDFLPLIQMAVLRPNDLIRLVAFPGQDDDIILLCMIHGPADGSPPVRDDDIRRLRSLDAPENIGDETFSSASGVWA